MNDLSSLRLGAMGELQISTLLLKHNLNVAKPVVDEGIDLIAMRNPIHTHEYVNIQIKTSTFVIRDKNINPTASFSITKTQLEMTDGIDFIFAIIAIYDNKIFGIYYIPRNVLKHTLAKVFIQRTPKEGKYSLNMKLQNNIFYVENHNFNNYKDRYDIVKNTSIII